MGVRHTPPTIERIIDLLIPNGITRDLICQRLKEGLAADRPVACDKEIFMLTDYETRLKYIRTILELTGELKLAENNITNINVLDKYKTMSDEELIKKFNDLVTRGANETNRISAAGYNTDGKSDTDNRPADNGHAK